MPKLPKILELEAIKRKAVKAASGGLSTLETPKPKNFLENFPPQEFGGLKAQTEAEVGKEAMPGKLMDLMAQLDEPGAALPERNIFGLNRMDITESGMPLDTGGKPGYRIETPDRTSAMKTLIEGSRQTQDFPFEMNPPMTSGSGRVLKQVGEGEGNLGELQNMFYGVEKHKELFDKDAAGIVKEWFSLKTPQGKAKAFDVSTKTKPESFMATLDEAVRVFDFTIKGKKTEIKALTDALGVREVKGEYRDRFYREWMQFKLNKKSWLEDNKGNKKLVAYFKQLETTADLLELLEEYKGIAEQLKNSKAPGIYERPPRTMSQQTPEKFRGMSMTPERQIDDALDTRDRFIPPKSMKEILEWNGPIVPVNTPPIGQGIDTLKNILFSKTGVANVPGTARKNLPMRKGGYEARKDAGVNLAKLTSKERDLLARRNAVKNIELARKVREGVFKPEYRRD